MDIAVPHSVLLFTPGFSEFAVRGLTLDMQTTGLEFAGSSNGLSPSVCPLSRKAATSTVHTSWPSQEFRERTKVAFGR